MESCNVQISLIEARGGLSKLKEASRGRRIHILGYFLCFYLKSFSQEKLLCILRYITSPLFTTMNFWLFITKIMEETEFTQYIFLGIRLILWFSNYINIKWFSNCAQFQFVLICICRLCIHTISSIKAETKYEQKKTAFLSGISFHFRPFIFR